MPIEKTGRFYMSTLPVLVADIGGTKSLFALAKKSGAPYPHYQLYEKRLYNNEQFSSGYAVLSEYLKSIGNIAIHNGVLGIAGHVQANSVYMTTLKWQFDEAQLKNDFGFRKINLLNDLEAMTMGVPFLNNTDYIEIQKGVRQQKGNICLVAAGTGLGEASSVYCEQIQDYHVIPGEGGQAGFSPVTIEQSELWNYILKTEPYASLESLLSGPGLVNIYKYLVENSRVAENPSVSIVEKNLTAKEITTRSNSGEDEYCIKAVDLFVSIYANEARNLAFRTLPYGGLYLGGGIAPKIFDTRNSTRYLEYVTNFLQMFLKKSKMSNFLENIPVYIITNENSALYGAAAFNETDIK
ncbi:MAG: glucokinase [Leptospirales bacterium]